MSFNGKHNTADVARIIFELRAARQMLGLSVPEVARRAGLSPSSVYDWERGHCQPDMWALQRWAKALGYKVSIDIEIEEEIEHVQR